MALDFETTGLDRRRDAVVSLGLVPVREGRVHLADVRYTMVRPSVPPSPQSIVIHHLRPVDLQRAPGVEQARHMLRMALEDRFVLTWAGEIEAAFLGNLFDGRPRRWVRRSIDVLRLTLAYERLSGSRVGRRPLSLSVAARSFGVPVEEAHHALDDAIMTAEVFLVVATRLAAFGFETVGSLLKASRLSSRIA